MQIGLTRQANGVILVAKRLQVVEGLLVLICSVKCELYRKWKADSVSDSILFTDLSYLRFPSRPPFFYICVGHSRRSTLFISLSVPFFISLYQSSLSCNAFTRLYVKRCFGFYFPQVSAFSSRTLLSGVMKCETVFQKSGSGKHFFSSSLMLVSLSL